MKPQRLTLSRNPLLNQQGFTLLEALVGLIIFCVIVLGSGVVLSQMFRSQKEMLVNSTIIDQLQARAQGAIGSPSSTTNLCGSIDKSSFVVSNTTYYVGCGTLTTSVTGVNTATTAPTITVQWPVLTVSNVSQANANTCATSPSTATSDCYIVGK